jgi:ribonuclease Y
MIIAAFIIGLLIGASVLFLLLRVTSMKRMLKAQTQASEIISDAKNEAETIKKEKLIEAEELIFEKKQKFEIDIEEKRSQLNKLERRLDQTEIEIDRKAEIVEKKEKEVQQQEKANQEKESYIEQKTAELNHLISEEIRKLEEISNLTQEEAKQILLKDMQEEAEKEGSQIAQSIISNAQLAAKRNAKEILVQAIQQISAEQSVEATITSINLPNDDMKGRIIGREGRNIRSFELVTGVDVIIDDTPEIVVLSCYDSYRREIAKKCLEKLISDGRIHPARIEEVYEKTFNEMRESLKEIGEQALLELGIHGVPVEVTELLGKLHYKTSQGQNLLNHSIEVARLAGIMAAELDLEVALAKRAGILHDIGKALENHSDSDHASLGAELLKKFNENEKVINAVEFHHNESKASTPITLLVAAANKISGSRPGARRESLESFIKRMKNFEELSDNFPGVKKSYALQAGRELRIIIDTEEIDDSRARELAREIAKKVLEEVEISSPVNVTVIREYRSYDYAT